MILLQKIKNSKSTGYFYYPNDTKGPGMIEIDTDTGDVYVKELSLFDKENDSIYFANKAKATVKKMWDSNDLPEEKFIAWG